jgi:hypothetical protein
VGMLNGLIFMHNWKKTMSQQINTEKQTILKSMKNETNPMKTLAAINRNLSAQFFNRNVSAKDVSMSIPKEVVLSEYLIN